MRRIHLAMMAAGIVGCSTVAGLPALAQSCEVSYGATDAAKSNKLFLYFPPVDDPTFPAYSPNVSPAKAFDVAALSPTIGTTAALIDAIRAVVVDDYCEFNVQVLSTTTNPETLAVPPARRVTVAIGSDGNGDTWGLARDTDIPGATDVDFARVWAGTYTTCEGSDPMGGCSTGTLTGAGATLGRWADAIGGTAAHEAGHTYGLLHADDDPPSDTVEPGPPPTPGEDSYHRHLMPAGRNLTGPDRAGYRRHFSDRTYSLLAADIGLSIQTMHNWDLKNPNAEEAHSLTIDFLSVLPALTLSGPYTGERSPWIDPVVTGPTGTATFRGATYNRYSITWSTANPIWQGSTPGIVPGGGDFHIGATFLGVDFDQPDPIIVQDVTLFDAASNPLTLHPRLPIYDAGTLDAADGTYAIHFFAPPAAPSLRLENVTVYQLPRVAAIASMVGAGEPKTRSGEPIRPWTVSTCQPARLRDGARCVVASLAQKPHVEVVHRVGEPGVYDCSGGIPQVDRPSRGKPDSLRAPDFEGPICAGVARDLFPSTTVYIIATAVDPQAKYYDPQLKRYVVGPLTSKVFLQVAGVRRSADGPDGPDGPNGPDGAGGVAGSAGAFGAPGSLLAAVFTGGSFPLSALRDRYTPSIHSGLALEWPFTPTFRAGLELGYHAFAAEPGVGGNLGVTDASLFVKILGATGPLRPFASAGVGTYRAFGSSQVGYQLGLGLELPVTGRAALATGLTARAVNGTSAGDLRFFDAWLGFELRLR